MKNKLFKIITLFTLTLTLHMISPTPVQAQCPMCRMSAESNLKNGGTNGKVLNAGIVYLLATPYLIVGTIGFIWWRNRRKNEEENEESLTALN